MLVATDKRHDRAPLKAADLHLVLDLQLDVLWRLDVPVAVIDPVLLVLNPVDILDLEDAWAVGAGLDFEVKTRPDACGLVAHVDI